MTSGFLDVEGARIRYEMRGAGPALLLISGAGGDAGFFSGLAEELADSFTVISYDRRGNSRSTGRTEGPMRLSDQADDARVLIEQLTDGRALVFGSSGGGIVALDLCTRHPDVVLGAVAHEPPVFRMLPDGAPGTDFYAQTVAGYHAMGSEKMGRLFAGAMGDDGAYEWPEDLLDRFLGNIDYLFEQEWAVWERFLPDLDALSVPEVPLVLAGGRANRGLFNGLPALEIAARAGKPWVEFPGVHLEYMVRPTAFGAALRVVCNQLYTVGGQMHPGWTALPPDTAAEKPVTADA